MHIWGMPCCIKLIVRALRLIRFHIPVILAIFKLLLQVCELVVGELQLGLKLPDDQIFIPIELNLLRKRVIKTVYMICILLRQNLKFAVLLQKRIKVYVILVFL